MGVAIVIPAFNADATIGETLRSVLSQTAPANEIIVVDDGSTDGTASLAASFRGVKIVRQQNKGAASALNTGIAASGEDLLAFIDADDLCAPERLEKQSELLRMRPDVDIVGGYMGTFVCPSVAPAQAARYRVPSMPEPCWLTGALMVRRDCFTKIGGFSEDLEVAFGIDWFDRARRSGATLAMLDMVVLHRRIRPGSLSHRSAKRDSLMVEMARRAIARRRPVQ